MYATLRRAATRKALAAGLATIVATAGIGVAVAAPSNPTSDRGVAAEVAAGALSRSSLVVEDPKVEVPTSDASDDPGVQDSAKSSASQEAGVEVETDANAGQAGAGAGGSSSVSPPTSPGTADPSSIFDDVQGDVDDEVGDPGDVAEGAEELAAGVIARIQACVGDGFGDFEDFEDFGDFGEGFDFGGSGNAGGSTAGGGAGFDFGGSGDFGQSFATDVVDDVLPCVALLVEDTLQCVSGLVEEILDAAMSMDLEQMLGMADIVVDELVSCVASAD